MRVSVVILFCLVCIAVNPALAQRDNLVPPPMPRAQAEIYDRVTSRVIAPCCWSQPVNIHQSEAATKVRAEIIAYLRQGDDEQQIYSRLASEYGERILGEPRGTRGTVAYVTPFVILGISLAGLALALFRIARRKPRQALHSGPLPDISDLEL